MMAVLHRLRKTTYPVGKNYVLLFMLLTIFKERRCPPSFGQCNEKSDPLELKK